MEKIALIIERVKEGSLWGRVHYGDDLIIEKASSLELLEKKMKKLLKDFHELDTKTIEFEIQYDIVGLFEDKKFLNVSALAEMAGINKSLMRQYASGQKFPSYDRAWKIVKVINDIGNDLGKVRIAAPDFYQVANQSRKPRGKA